MITDEDMMLGNDPLARRRANTINDLRSLAEEIRRSQRGMFPKRNSISIDFN
jgi:hypothetical protein